MTAASKSETADRVARILNRSGVAAMPLPRLSAISIFADDEYENYDLDLIGPRVRRQVIAAMKGAGFAHTRGLEFRRGDEIVRFPRPKSVLGTDPSTEAEQLVARDDCIALVTPTQAALMLLKRGGEIRQTLADMAYEQPMNIPKVVQWSRPAGTAAQFAAMRADVEAAQKLGIEQRRARTFRSRLPR